MRGAEVGVNRLTVKFQKHTYHCPSSLSCTSFVLKTKQREEEGGGRRQGGGKSGSIDYRHGNSDHRTPLKVKECRLGKVVVQFNREGNFN